MKVEISIEEKKTEKVCLFCHTKGMGECKKLIQIKVEIWDWSYCHGDEGFGGGYVIWLRNVENINRKTTYFVDIWTVVYTTKILYRIV